MNRSGIADPTAREVWLDWDWGLGMSELIEFAGDFPIIVEIADRGSTRGGGVQPVGAGLSSIPTKVATTFQESLRMIGAVGDAVRSSLEGAGVEEAQVKIGLKASGTGQFIIAQTTIEGAVEVTFKVKVSK
jgi:hypothetical protein